MKILETTWNAGKFILVCVRYQSFEFFNKLGKEKKS